MPSWFNHRAKLLLAAALVPLVAATTVPWLGGPLSPTLLQSGLTNRVVAPVAAIEGTQSCAEAQSAEYFALMPSKVLPTVSLDLRAWASTADDNVEAGVFAKQEGTVRAWKNIGVVATTDAASFTQAVAKQRALIERWAYEFCNNFETNERVIVLDGPPIEIAWAVRPPKPSLFESLQGKKEEPPLFTLVRPGACFEEGLRCGFLGVLARQYRGGGVSARNDRIIIGKEPEMPLRSASQAKYDSKYLRED